MLHFACVRCTKHFSGVCLTAATNLYTQHCGKIYSECMGKIVILMLDNSRKFDILQFL